MAKARRKCRRTGCDEELHCGGLCLEHYEEDDRQQRLRRDALRALHLGVIDGGLPECDELREDLDRIGRWWSRACNATNSGRQDPVLVDEARYALEWCIRLAEQIVMADRVLRSGGKPDRSLAFTREWVWDRFRNLEAGLMSNGVKRPE